ncbi:MAG TPA: phosphoglycolate phosphatase [Chiayiivirga sp.]|nr:phosphoglycolate phosphatase [Chiayiivirga sp.]
MTRLHAAHPSPLAAAILFDLDGTLVDSSGDLTAAINVVRADLGLAPVPVEQVRTAISSGSRAILSLGLPELEAQEREVRVEQFLRVYQALIGEHDGLFPGIDAVLEALESAGSRWGVVTNKREDLARIVLDRLGLSQRCAVLIGGNTLARNKPDPLPVVTACERLGVSPQAAVFVGDDARDVAAGRAAGSTTVAVRWGFHPSDSDPAGWGADWVIDRPDQLLATFAAKP